MDDLEAVDVRPPREAIRKDLMAFGNGFQCAICLDHYAEPLMFPCTHSACSHCAQGWLDTKKECPVCKESVRCLLLLSPGHRNP